MFCLPVPCFEMSGSSALERYAKATSLEANGLMRIDQSSHDRRPWRRPVTDLHSRNVVTSPGFLAHYTSRHRGEDYAPLCTHSLKSGDGLLRGRRHPAFPSPPGQDCQSYSITGAIVSTSGGKHITSGQRSEFKIQVEEQAWTSHPFPG